MGCEICDLDEATRNECGHYKGKVVFPAGAIVSSEQLLVSVGVNDSSCYLVPLKEKDLKL